MMMKGAGSMFGNTIKSMKALRDAVRDECTKPCSVCKGKGEYFDGTFLVWCTKCIGTGRVPKDVMDAKDGE